MLQFVKIIFYAEHEAENSRLELLFNRIMIFEWHGLLEAERVENIFFGKELKYIQL